MTNQSTIDKLIEMRLTAMADAFRIQMNDPTMKCVCSVCSPGDPKNDCRDIVIIMERMPVSITESGDSTQGAGMPDRRKHFVAVTNNISLQ